MDRALRVAQCGVGLSAVRGDVCAAPQHRRADVKTRLLLEELASLGVLGGERPPPGHELHEGEIPEGGRFLDVLSLA
jgi:hypothetical protein